ncbi:MAG: ribonuclease H-like domain-containing protein [Desulfobacterium sp.]|nr:ribonuclease H-like domain-containing protein [Desulfobacterium sp.]
MKKVIAFDLETIADKTMISILPEVKVNGSLKDPVKIAADIQKKTDKQIQEMGLSPMMNMICCAGWCDENGPGNILLKEESPEAEKALLEEFWDLLSKYDHFVTFNGRAFDLRCMHLHGVTHGIRPSVAIDKGRYNNGNHTDLRLILAGDDKFVPGKLDFFAQKFLGEQKTEGIDGAMVNDYWNMGLVEDIATYCEQDCQLAYDLFLKCELAGLTE